MNLIKSRQFATLVSFLLIIFSTIFIGGNDIKKIRNETYNMYSAPAGENVRNIESELDNIKGQASNVITILKRYLDKGSAEEIDELQKAIDMSEDGKEFKDRMELTNDIVNKVNTILEKKESYNLSQNDMDYLLKIEINIKSSNRIISNSGYSEEAKKFNDIIDKFPANLISKIRSIKPL